MLTNKENSQMLHKKEKNKEQGTSLDVYYMHIIYIYMYDLIFWYLVYI